MLIPILTKQVDLSAPPKKILLQKIMEISLNHSEKEILGNLLKDDKWRDEYRPNILDFLELLPGLRIGPEEFTKMLDKIEPRMYSIASCPKVMFDKEMGYEISVFEILIEINTFENRSFGDGFIQERSGLCSGYLMRSMIGDVIMSLHCPNTIFKMPLTSKTPIGKQ